MLSLSSALLQICFLLMRAHSTAAAARSLAGSMAGEATRSGDAAHQDSLSPAGVAAPRLLACSLMKNEVPYALEWIEFHRLMGFDRIVIYDDFSTDNASMLSSLYEQHGRHYLTIEPGLEDEDPRIRRIRSAADCFTKYKDQSDWLIHLDIDEFVWSPAHPDLPTYFMQEVPDKAHIIYAGATRFGFNGQKSRHSFALHEASFCVEAQVQRLFPCLLAANGFATWAGAVASKRFIFGPHKSCSDELSQNPTAGQLELKGPWGQQAFAVTPDDLLGVAVAAAVPGKP